MELVDGRFKSINGASHGKSKGKGKRLAAEFEDDEFSEPAQKLSRRRKRSAPKQKSDRLIAQILFTDSLDLVRSFLLYAGNLMQSTPGMTAEIMDRYMSEVKTLTDLGDQTLMRFLFFLILNKLPPLKDFLCTHKNFKETEYAAESPDSANRFFCALDEIIHTDIRNSDAPPELTLRWIAREYAKS